MPIKQKAPYGSWKSPITMDLMLSDSVGLGELSHYKDEVYWIEMRPQEKGRYVVVKQTPEGEQVDVIPQDFNAHTRVHEYGGGSYLLTDKGLIFTNFKDQNLYLINSNDECIKITEQQSCRYADMIYDSKNDRLICVREDHAGNDGEAINTIVSISLSEPGKENILVEGADFYSSPRLSPDGGQLCWIEWLHPNMPWDNTILLVAEVINDEQLGERITVAGNGEAVCQPVWSEENSLYFISDRNNWWNIYRYNNNEIECVLEMEAEFAVPQWSFRECSYTFINHETIAAIYRKEGIAFLGLIDLLDGKINTQSLPFTDLESIVSNKEKLWFLAGSPRTFPSIIEYDIHQKRN